MISSNLLSLIPLMPILGLLAILCTPPNKENFIRRISNTVMLISLLLSVWIFVSYDHLAGGFQFTQLIPWVKPLGISWHLGIDGINALMVLLVGIGGFACSLMSKSISFRVKEYYALLLFAIAGTFGAFLSLDIFFFYFLHEFATIPTFLLISIWGSDRRDYGALKITLYLTAGASLALIGLIALYFATGLNTFNLIAIQQHLAANPIPVQVQHWIFPIIVIGFGITLTMWPFHSWAPVSYASAPTAVSMLHAGIIKKLGAYAIIRFAIELMPEGAHMWMPFIAVLGIINILFCGLVALTQRDIKYVLAYSSCSHMGYIFLGLAALNIIGLNGVVYLMFAHGILACLSFALMGFIEDQAKTRNLDQLGGLLKTMPFVGTCFMMAALASAGVPGFGNFVAEIMVLIGAWGPHQLLTVLAILGVVISAIYMFKTIRLGFHGPQNTHLNHLKDATTLSAKLPFVLLLVTLIIIGCWPKLILEKIAPATQTIAERIASK